MSLTSSGSKLYSPKKAGKSSFVDFFYQNGELYEIFVNSEVCANIEALHQKAGTVGAPEDGQYGQSSTKDNVTIGQYTTTPIMLKHMGIEIMLATCDADKPRRLHFSVRRADAEMASLCDQFKMLGSAGQAKKYENQGAATSCLTQAGILKYTGIQA